MTNGNGNGNGSGHGNGHPYRVLMDDEDLAAKFEQLISAAQAKGYNEEEIGFGLLSATAETLLVNGEPECCVMQLLIDFTSSYFDYWHSRMSDDEEKWEEDEEL
jgi:hypothetical protein